MKPSLLTPSRVSRRPTKTDRCALASKLVDAPTRGEAAAAVEFVLEGLHLTRRLSKEQTDDGRTLYGS